MCHFYTAFAEGLFHYSTEVPLAPTTGQPPPQLPVEIEGGGPLDAAENIFYFNDKMYFCRLNEACSSWDIFTGQWNTSASTDMVHVENKRDGRAITEVNNKIWISGGFNYPGDATANSAFLDDQGVWTAGPDLPEANNNHNTVTISDYEVLYFGGYVGGSLSTCHMLDTRTNLFTEKALYTRVKYGTAAAKVTLKVRISGL